ncbi:MAG TPA: dTDP-4-dehydrorhamnose 3,5-epimerase [Terriglobales bacterium]|nr:dTDP-4-dehydrorhamnose 3,5-epimerase [Terriglobales bacterium]
MAASTPSSLQAIKATPTPLHGVLVLEPRVFTDTRGFFLESYSERAMKEVGVHDRFVQDNHSCSVKNVVRGLHYQICHAQGKLIRVVAGEIFDVAVDLRRNSLTFGKWHGVRLSAQNYKMLWIPAGLAHGFSVLSDAAHVLYKATDFYHPECERTLAWNDPDIKIDWELRGAPIVSTKDSQGVLFRNLNEFL